MSSGENVKHCFINLLDIWIESKSSFSIKINKYLALAGMAQWIECQPADQGVDGLVPSLGHMPGLWARSLMGACDRQLHIDVSLPPFPSLK